MDFTDDDADFWDDPGYLGPAQTTRPLGTAQTQGVDPDRTSQIQRVRGHSPERTRTHHVVTRDVTRPVSRDLTRSQPVTRLDDDEAVMWFDNDTRPGRFGPFSSVDPRLLSVGAIALAAVLAVPLFGALGDEGNGDSMRSVNEQSTTTIPVAVTTIAPVEITAAVDTAVSGELETDRPSESGGDDAEESSSASQGDAAAQPQGLRADPGCGNQYTAVAGDYWLRVAEATGTSLDDVLALNDATTDTPIFPGDTICLPDGASVGGSGGSGESVAVLTPNVPAQCANAYTVAAGDYWLGIAGAAGVALDDLLAANSATPDTQLFPGSEVCLPAGAAVPSAPTSSAVVTTAPTTAAASTAPATTAPSTTEPSTTASTTEPDPTDPPAPPPAPAEIEQMIRDVWPDDLEEQALRIAWRESSYRPTARNHCCHGLFQIHWEAHNDWLADHGVDEVSDLYDARTNVEMAYVLYQRSGSWDPWSMTRD